MFLGNTHFMNITDMMIGRCSGMQGMNAQAMTNPLGYEASELCLPEFGSQSSLPSLASHHLSNPSTPPPAPHQAGGNFLLGSLGGLGGSLGSFGGAHVGSIGPAGSSLDHTGALPPLFDDSPHDAHQ